MTTPDYIDKKPITSKRRMGKMLKRMLNERSNNNNRIKNRLAAEAERDRNLLRRDLTRGHHTTRVARALRRAATQTNPNKDTK